MNKLSLIKSLSVMALALSCFAAPAIAGTYVMHVPEITPINSNPLLKAIDSGNLEEIKRLYGSATDPKDAIYGSYMQIMYTALDYAVYRGALPAVKLLVSLGAQIDQSNPPKTHYLYGRIEIAPTLYFAAHRDDAALWDTLISLGARIPTPHEKTNICAITTWETTFCVHPILTAVASGNLTIFRKLLATGLKPDEEYTPRDWSWIDLGFRSTPMGAAIVYGRNEMIQELVSLGVSPKLRGALDNLSWSKYPETFTLLVKLGVDPNVLDRLVTGFGDKPDCGETFMNQLLKAGAPANPGIRQALTSYGSLSCRLYYLDRFFAAGGALVSLNPWHAHIDYGKNATENDYLALVRALELAPNASDFYYEDLDRPRNFTLLHQVASDSTGKSLLDLLLKAKVDWNRQDARGNTPLHYAVMKKRSANIPVLIQAGAKVDIKNAEGKAPFDYL